MDAYLRSLFSLDGKVALITGGTGVLGGAMAVGLARAGAKVAVMGRRAERAEETAGAISSAGGEAVALPADVLQRGELESAREKLLAQWSRIDILVNAAGGNVPVATVREDTTFFELPRDALEDVVDLNLLGTILPSQVFGELMAQQHEGCIVNISSLSAHRALTRVVGYGVAKAGVEQLTRWLAVELSRNYGPGLRVNAIAPGFFLSEQNRRLMLNPDGSLAERGQAVVAHTPAGRLGEPEDLLGTLVWLCSPSASFVNGTVITVDGGFDAFSGV